MPGIVEKTDAFKSVLQRDSSDSSRDRSKQFVSIAVRPRVGFAAGYDEASAWPKLPQTIERTLIDERRNANLRPQPLDFTHPAAIVVQIGQLGRNQQVNGPRGRGRSQQDEITQNSDVLHEPEVKCDEPVHSYKFAAVWLSALGAMAIQSGATAINISFNEIEFPLSVMGA